MILKPRNRYILLSEILQNVDNDKPTILLPEEYKTRSNPHGVYKIQLVSDDCTKLKSSDSGKLVIVSDSMVEKINIDQGNFLLILENHIYAILED